MCTGWPTLGVYSVHLRPAASACFSSSCTISNFSASSQCVIHFVMAKREAISCNWYDRYYKREEKHLAQAAHLNSLAVHQHHVRRVQRLHKARRLLEVCVRRRS